MTEEQPADALPVCAFIIDEETPARNHLEKLLTDFYPSVPVAGTSGSMADALHRIGNLPPSLVFLDIETAGLRFADFTEHLCRHGHSVVFVAARAHLAIETFKRSAVTYLLKLAGPHDLTESVKKALKQFGHGGRIQPHVLQQMFSELYHTPSSDKLLLPTSHGFEVADLSGIIRIQAEGHATSSVHTSARQILVSKSIAEFEKLLHNTSFLRVHPSHIINIDFLEAFETPDGGTAIMHDKKAVPIARRQLSKFKALVKKTYQHF